jgi:acyl-ACP thioesterase
MRIQEKEKNIMSQSRKDFEEIDTIRQFSRQYNYTVRGTETDTKDVLAPVALLSMLQEAASIDAEYNSLGATELDPEGFCWLLMRTSARLARTPKWKDCITVDTWTNGVERLFSIREFLLTDQNGTFLGKATTSWLVVDKKSHRPQKIAVLNDTRVIEKSVSALGYNSPKLMESMNSQPEHPILSIQAGFSEIDRNLHVNNTRYIAWALDAVGRNGIPDSNLIGLDINYTSEVKIGETINLYLNRLPLEQGFNPVAKDACMVVGRHEEDQRTAFSTILYWDGLL